MPDHQFRRTLFIVAGLNLAYFVIEFAAAAVIGSVSLADSIDFSKMQLPTPRS